MNTIEFTLQEQKNQLLQKFTTLDLTVQRLPFERMEEVITLRNRCFQSPSVWNSYWMYSIMTFGNLWVLQDKNQKLAAYHQQGVYLDVPKTAFTFGIAVDAAYRGHQLATALLQYSSIKAYQNGAQMGQAFVGLTNYASLKTFLLYCSGKAIRYVDGIDVLGKRLLIQFPIEYFALGKKRSKASIEHILQTQEEGKYYCLVLNEDIEKIEKLLNVDGYQFIDTLQREDQWYFLATKA